MIDGDDRVGVRLTKGRGTEVESADSCLTRVTISNTLSGELLRHQARKLLDRVRLHDTDAFAVRRGHAPPVDAVVLALPQDDRATATGGDPELGVASSTSMRSSGSGWVSRIGWWTRSRSRRRSWPSISPREGNLVPAFGEVAAHCARTGRRPVCPEGPIGRTGPARDVDIRRRRMVPPYVQCTMTPIRAAVPSAAPSPIHQA